MDYEQFFPKQMAKECSDEHYIIGVFSIIFAVSILLDCISMCRANRKMRALQYENETLKSIVLKSMERGVLRMMNQPTEDDHED